MNSVSDTAWLREWFVDDLAHTRRLIGRGWAIVERPTSGDERPTRSRQETSAGSEQLPKALKKPVYVE